MRGDFLDGLVAFHHRLERGSRTGMGKRLYVGNLPYDTSEEGLKQAFGQDGRQVTTVHLVMDRETGRPRGFAFVEMANDDDAKKAIVAMDGADFGGRRLRVNEAEDRRGPARPGGPGGGGSGSGGGAGYGGARPAGGPPRPASGGGGGGGGGHSRPRPNWVDAPPGGSDAKKYADTKPQRRPHDEEPDTGGRRGARRFDDDDDE
jgi:RNA recognition motif-containing protein